MTEYLSIVLGVLAAGGQLFNYVLHLRVKNAILESEEKTLEKCDCRYVRKEICLAEMRRLEQQRG